MTPFTVVIPTVSGTRLRFATAWLRENLDDTSNFICASLPNAFIIQPLAPNITLDDHIKRLAARFDTPKDNIKFELKSWAKDKPYVFLPLPLLRKQCSAGDNDVFILVVSKHDLVAIQPVPQEQLVLPFIRAGLMGAEDMVINDKAKQD